jgi:hypothetical protein
LAIKFVNRGGFKIKCKQVITPIVVVRKYVDGFKNGEYFAGGVCAAVFIECQGSGLFFCGNLKV